MTVIADDLRLTALFVRAAGLSDEAAREWLRSQLPDPSQAWRRHGHRVLAELSGTGHERIQERLVGLLGRPDGREPDRGAPGPAHGEPCA